MYIEFATNSSLTDSKSLFVIIYVSGLNLLHFKGPVCKPSRVYVYSVWVAPRSKIPIVAFAKGIGYSHSWRRQIKQNASGATHTHYIHTWVSPATSFSKGEIIAQQKTC